MHRRNINLYCEWRYTGRWCRNMEQQQPRRSDSKCGRIGDRSIGRYIQYYLHDKRRLRRYKICPADCNHKSECGHFLSDWHNTFVYWSHSDLYAKRSCAERRNRRLEQQQPGCGNSEFVRTCNRFNSRNMQYNLYNHRRLRRNCIIPAVRYS